VRTSPLGTRPYGPQFDMDPKFSEAELKDIAQAIRKVYLAIR
jgi:hypothetical protein